MARSYGFLWWLWAELTVVSVLNGNGLAWSVEQARARFRACSVRPGRVAVRPRRAPVAIGRLLFSDDVPSRATRGGFQAVLRDAAAGTIGGLLFTLVTWQTGILAQLAKLVEEHGAAGLAVHLLVSTAQQGPYGQLFRRLTPGSWVPRWPGASPCGLLWWILSALTLLPMLMGGAPSGRRRQPPRRSRPWSGTSATGSGSSGLPRPRDQARLRPRPPC